MSTDHRMILAEIKGEGARRNRMYCKVRSIWTIVTPKEVPIQEGESNFSDLKKTVKKPTHKARLLALWISESTWILSDHRTELRRTHTENQQKLKRATRRFQAALKEDRRHRVRKVG